MKKSREEQTRQEISTAPVCPHCKYAVEPEWDTCPFCTAREAIPWTLRTWQSVIDSADPLASPWKLFREGE